MTANPAYSTWITEWKSYINNEAIVSEIKETLNEADIKFAEETPKTQLINTLVNMPGGIETYIKRNTPENKDAFWRYLTTAPEPMLPSYEEPEIEPLQSNEEEVKPFISEDAGKSSQGFKGAKPEPFDGKTSSVKKFWFSCMLYISGLPKEFSNDDNMITFILSYFKEGIPLEWAIQFQRDRDDWNKKTPAGNRLTKFHDKFTEDFGETDPGYEARLTLRKLYQGNLNMDEFVTKFKTIASLSKLDNVALSDMFATRIHKKTLERVWMSGKPNSLEEWYKKAKEADRLERQLGNLNEDCGAVSLMSYNRIGVDVLECSGHR